MPKRACIAIGVDRSCVGQHGGFPPLRAAAQGAKDIAEWARRDRFDTVVELQDSDGQPVTLKSIKDAVAPIVAARNYSQLVIHFSGHGLLKGDYELWMLSGAPADPVEAVNVPQSITHSRHLGIPHVVFFSDACRTLPANYAQNCVTGGSVFPPGKPAPPLPAVDVFYATLMCEPAYEAPPAELAVEMSKAHRGIFTDCALKALRGKASEVTELREEPSPPCNVVSGWTLKKHLERVVPIETAKVNLKLKQEPDIRVESRLPDCLTASPTISMAGFGPAFPTVPPAPPTQQREAVDLVQLAMDDPEKARAKIGVLASEAADQLLKTEGRASFETGVGFSVFGSGVQHAMVADAQVDLFMEHDATHIRCYRPANFPNAPSVLIRFDDGTGTVLAVMPGFVGTVLVERGRQTSKVVSVAYTPARGTARFDDFRAFEPQVRAAHAIVAAAARYGGFRIERDLAGRTADSLRRFKFYDPTLGIYAAYAYAQIGDEREIRSVLEYMERDQDPVPFDVALLADRLPPMLNRMQHVAPFCPMLGQGWALLGEAEARLHPAVALARTHLVPSLWTTFGREGVDILEAAIATGALH